MKKKSYQSYYTYRKELYGEINKQWNIQKIGLLRKYSKFEKNHTSSVKPILQGLVFTFMMNIIMNLLLWFLIIPNSELETSIKGVIATFAYMLLILAPLSRWLFPTNFSMSKGMLSTTFTSVIMFNINTIINLPVY